MSWRVLRIWDEVKNWLRKAAYNPERGLETSHGVANLFGRLRVGTSVADPDPRVFGPPGSGSGSISQRHGSGSGSGSESF